MEATPFTIENIPYGVISTKANVQRRCATAFEENAVDLSILEKHGLFHLIAGFEKRIFALEHLNAFANLPQVSRSQVRERIIGFLSEGNRLEEMPHALIPLSQVTNHFPMQTSNFSDFYCSLEHTRNCLEIFGVKDIPQNWFSTPLVYNGRTSSLVVSGTPITRPYGVYKSAMSSELPSFRPSEEVDFELEMGVFLSKPVPFGSRARMSSAKDHIFGMVLLNDWSSRDLQRFEMPPLGPFHGKGFGTSISPWIVTLEALEKVQSARAEPQDPRPLPHLSWNGDPTKETFDIELAVAIIRNGRRHLVTSSNLNTLQWTPYQQLTHLGSAGEGLSTGDIFGMGTISSSRMDTNNEKIGLGCLLERQLTRNKLLSLKNTSLSYLQDGDEVVIEGWCKTAEGISLFGFGECRGIIAPPVLPDDSS